MSITFIGQHAVVSPQDVVRFGPLRVWAERGLIHIEDERTGGGYKVHTVKTALRRIKAVSDMLGNSVRMRQKYGVDELDQLEWNRQMKAVEGIVALASKAQAQGMPSDPTAVRDAHRRLPKTIGVPSNYTVARTPKTEHRYDPRADF